MNISVTAEIPSLGLVRISVPTSLFPFLGAQRATIPSLDCTSGLSEKQLRNWGPNAGQAPRLEILIWLLDLKAPGGASHRA